MSATMSNRTDEEKLVHFAGVLGLKFTRRPGGFCRWALPDGQTLVDGFGSADLPDFALDEAQMGRVFSALRQVTAADYEMFVEPTQTRAIYCNYYGKEVAADAPTEQQAAFALVLAVTGFEDD